jgi:methylmalonyl-CoA/ethylmalonyl-CoA epimerase
MLRIEHIGIAVKDLDLSNELFSKLLNRSHYKVEEVTSEKVATSFFKPENRKLNY